MVRRLVCCWVIMSLLGVLSPVAVLAQTAARPDDRDSYVADVASRAALAEDLEARRSEAAYRRQTIEESIRRLEAEEPPAGANVSEWNAQRTERVQWLNDYMTRNEEALGRYESNLSSVRGQLDQDRSYIMSSNDDELKQALGSLVGVAGVAGIPVYSRPTMGTLKAAVGRTYMGMKLSSTTKAITSAQGKQAALTTQASSLSAPVKGQWVTEVGANGNLVLRNGSTVKDLGVKAQMSSADGTPIRNDSAYRKADYYTQINSAKSNIEYSISKLKYERSVAKNAKGQQALDAKIQELEGKKAQLEQDIAKHDSENPSAKSQLKTLAASAAKWALFSAGVTVATRAFEELRANDWNFRAIDWGNVVAPLKTAEFWGGTAGSFVGSMALSAIIPGGAFVKTLAAVGGAAIGWQLGSGNLMQTDWMELGASSLGATIGSLLGAFLGPVGSLIGGMAGHYAAVWLLGKVRDWLGGGYVAYDRSSREDYTGNKDAAPYVYQPEAKNSYGSPDEGMGGASYSDAASIQNRLMELQVEMQAIMQANTSGAQMTLLDQKRREYGDLQRQLSDMRQSAAPDYSSSY